MLIKQHSCVLTLIHNQKNQGLWTLQAVHPGLPLQPVQVSGIEKTHNAQPPPANQTEKAMKKETHFYFKIYIYFKSLQETHKKLLRLRTACPGVVC